MGAPPTSLTQVASFTKLMDSLGLMDSLDESRYFNLLTTNHEPSDMEVPELRKVIAQRELSLRQFDFQIAEARRMLASLIERRKLEQKLLTRYRAVVSPIRRLPHDVLVEIFLQTGSWEPDAFLMHDMEPLAVGPRLDRSLLRITHVCAEWRRVALRTPALWSTIASWYEGHGIMSPKISPLPDRRLPVRLARTGTHSPLDIKFEVSRLPRGPPPSPWMLDRLPRGPGAPLSWVAPYIHRVRTFSLKGDVDVLPSGSYDMLEMLRMADGYVHHFQEASISMPSLRRLGYSEVFVPFAFIPWQRLTHLYMDVDFVDWSKFLHTVRQSAALLRLDVSCQLIVTDPAMESNNVITDAERFELVHLEVLCLDGKALSLRLLPYLTLPALTNLRLTHYSRPVYHALQSRSSFMLKSFTFRGPEYGMDESDIFDLLSRTESLTDLHWHTVSPILVDGLSWNLGTPGASKIAPNLEYLGMLQGYSPEDQMTTSDDAIFKMIMSREPSGRPTIFNGFAPALNTRIFKSRRPKRP
ncbi:hypothetical protein Hypma_004915 [Hypsizygus marmoreus]|uniref:Uncharacterized protein n=1 Tax=Hypsizygus marmoreus TaxID=39966 RepID=A0A369KDE7_HYPMA|nr:hypothetical protein Hypma_004915 [Hypsizygus marmoreus]